MSHTGIVCIIGLREKIACRSHSYMYLAFARFEPATLRTKGVESINAPTRSTRDSCNIFRDFHRPRFIVDYKSVSATVLIVHLNVIKKWEGRKRRIYNISNRQLL